MTTPGATSFDISRQQRAVVLAVHGTLDLAAASRIGAVLGDLIEGQGNLNVGVDLREVDQLDPAALGVFSVAAAVARRRGGELRLIGSPPGPAPWAGEIAPHAHLAGFYDTDDTLAVSVGRYLAPALRTDGAAVVVATHGHRRLFEDALDHAGIDVERARAGGRYVDADAEETLSRAMVDGAPDSGAFNAVVRSLIRRSPAAPGTPRVYGEMVGLLLGDGDLAGAMAVEDLWNRLRHSQRFTLVCGYPRASFDGALPSGSLRSVCERHTAA